MGFWRNAPAYRNFRLHYLRGYRAPLQKRRADAAGERQRFMLAQIGLMTIVWASIETVVDALIDWYHPIGGALIQETLPRSLGSKIDYLNKMARDDGFTEATKTGLISLKKELKRLGKARHSYLHGAVWDRAGDGRNCELHIKDFRADPPIVKQYKFTPDEIQGTIDQMGVLLHAISPWVATLIALPEYPRAFHHSKPQA